MHVFELQEFRKKCFNCKNKNVHDKYALEYSSYCSLCKSSIYVNSFDTFGHIRYISIRSNKTEVKINFILNQLVFWKIDSNGRSCFQNLNYKLLNINVNDFISDYNSSIIKLKKMLILI